jgi:hypothetical protein
MYPYFPVFTVSNWSHASRCMADPQHTRVDTHGAPCQGPMTLDSFVLLRTWARRSAQRLSDIAQHLRVRLCFDHRCNT